VPNAALSPPGAKLYESPPPATAGKGIDFAEPLANIADF
jgi:hypothetical protein